MLVDVEILNIFCYVDKKTNEKKCAIGYRILNEDSKADTPKFKGYSNLTIFLDDTKLFEEFDNRYFGKHLVLELNEVSRPDDPVRRTVTLVKIKIEKNEDLYIL